MVEATVKIPLRVGLTGGIGSGKSTVSDMFMNLGVPVIDADVLAHRLTEPGQAAWSAIVQSFGREVLDHTGALDRGLLREQVFSDPEKRKTLEAILHPLVYDGIKSGCTGIDSPYVLIVIPLLLETGGVEHVDRVLVVDCDEEEQIRRVLARDRTSREDVSRILAAQTDREIRLKSADDIIINDRDLAHLENQVQDLHEKYLTLARTGQM
ncbi:MAG: dephospho-CoA kinase [Gammaproteobacteria bacterium]|nr:dephospho-CoA kinase [Gammaproteobacteria bacterium]